jgi:hypothetical protein
MTGGVPLSAAAGEGGGRGGAVRRLLGGAGLEERLG